MMASGVKLLPDSRQLRGQAPNFGRPSKTWLVSSTSPGAEAPGYWQPLRG